MQHPYKPRIRKDCTCLCQATAACEAGEALCISESVEGQDEITHLKPRMVL